MARIVVLAALLAAVSAETAAAASPGAAPDQYIDNYVIGDDSVYDLDHNGHLDAKELAVKALHESPATKDLYNAIDVIRIDGVFDAQELAQYYAKARKDSAKQLDPLLKQVKGGVPEKNGIDIVALYQAEKALRCAGGQGLYIRQDQFDVGVYAQSLAAGKATGASLKIAQDLAANTTTATIHGFASDVAYRSPCMLRPSGSSGPYVSGYVFAPWVFANGTAGGAGKTPASTLKVGLNNEFEIAGAPLLDLQYYTLSPYFQTDFQDDARIVGGQAIWTPYRYDWRLNAFTGLGSPLDYYWAANLIGDFRYVDVAGNSGLKAGASYGWLGEHFGIVADVLPKQFKHNLTFNAAYDAAWNTIGGGWATEFTSSLAWNFVDSASLTLAYTSGTDRDTLVKSDQVTLSLNYKQ